MSVTDHIPQNVLIKQWRERMGFSRADVARLTGFAPSMIGQFESGVHPQTGKPVSAREIHKFKCIAAAITAGIQFDWVNCTFEIVERRKIDLMPK